MIRSLIKTVFFLLALVSCRQEKPAEAPLFTLRTATETGIDFRNDLTNKKLDILRYMYYYNGGGVSAGDFNNDGLSDLYFTSNEGANKLYLNQGGFRFRDITATTGVAGNHDWSTGTTLVDINNDGYLDIYVCHVAGIENLTGHNLLYVNNGDLTFTERSAEYGLDFSGLSTQAVFFDYDLDGDLDMYLLNHSIHGVNSYGYSALRMENSDLAGDRLYQNKSETGKIYFENVTKKSGIYTSHIGYGLGVAVSDINQDGWPDIYVSNDFHENDYLYINNSNGTFTESLEKYLAHTSRYSMGCDISDINNDGLPDIVSLDMLPEDPEILLKSVSEDTQEVYEIKAGFGYGSQYVRNCLQLNRGDYFTEIAQYAGIHATDWSWSALMADLDNDSRQEIFITNGIYKRPNDQDYIQYTSLAANIRSTTTNQDSVDRLLMMRLPTLQIPNYVYRQQGDLRFTNISGAWGLNQPSFSNGAVYADLDNDGDLDLVINNVNQEAFVYENHSSVKGKNNYIAFELRSPANHFGIGARAIVYAGQQQLMREMILTRGFQSSVEPVLHFGLGDISRIDSVEIIWPGNKRQVVKEAVLNSKNVIQQGESLASSALLATHKTASPWSRAAVEIAWKHEENKDFKDYVVDPLMPCFLGAEGPALAVADVNGDGLDDFYLGGSHYQPGVLMMQTQKGNFLPALIQDFLKDAQYEDTDAVFVDVNGDQAPDLYVVSGGSQYWEGLPFMEDRLYINDGEGGFVRSRNSLPPVFVNGSVVRAADIDGDGDMDLFVGSRSVSGIYGLTPASYILRNDGKGNFSIHQELKAGMITDAAWFDYDRDGLPDLLLVGDWMPLTIYQNDDRKFEQIEVTGFKNTEGWWRSVTVADLNSDGHPDIVAGNIGENVKLRPTPERPVTLYFADFDDNGKPDPVIFYYQGNNHIPFQSKVQLAKQMPYVNKRFTNYLAFSLIREPADLLPEEKLRKTKPQSVYTFASKVFLSDGKGGFQPISMPLEMQFSSAESILIDDVNGDRIPDILLAGNNHSHAVNLGNTDSQSLLLLQGSPTGTFRVVSINDQQNFKNDYRCIRPLKRKGITNYILAGNNAVPEVYQYSRTENVQ